MKSRRGGCRVDLGCFSFEGRGECCKESGMNCRDKGLLRNTTHTGEVGESIFDFRKGGRVVSGMKKKRLLETDNSEEQRP